VRGANILYLGIKELRSLIRDPILVVFIAYSLTAAIYAGATGMPETLHRAAIAIVDEDHSTLSARIAGAFHPPYFAPPRMIGPSEMDARLDTGADTFALDIPPGFQRDLLAGRTPAVQLNVDATNITQALTGSNDIQAIVRDEVRSFIQHTGSVATPPVDLALRVRFNPSLEPSWFGAVMELINEVNLLAILLPGAALIREREHGTVEHLLAMPVTPFQIMTAKLWSMGLVVLVGCGISLAFVVQGLLRIPVEGSVALFLAGAALFLFAATSMGMALGTLARSMPQFGLLLMLVVIPLEILSGGVTPRESMPEFVQWLMVTAPTTHFVLLAQAILFRGAGFSVVWPEFAALAAIGAGLFGYALARFRRAIGTMA
jgi:ABC-2 type transport system permease protein